MKTRVLSLLSSLSLLGAVGCGGNYACDNDRSIQTTTTLVGAPGCFKASPIRQGECMTGGLPGISLDNRDCKADIRVQASEFGNAYTLGAGFGSVLDMDVFGQSPGAHQVTVGLESEGTSFSMVVDYVITD